MDTYDPELVKRANSLYWESDASVNDIADQLDLSKGALYGMVQPLGADLSCPECGTGLEFPNRTAHEKGMVSCPGCGLEEEFALVQAAALDVQDDVPGPPPSAEARPLPPVTVRTLVASTLLGLAAGIAIGQLTGRR
ncbi:MAG: hypothetical protein JSU98_04885 [Gemmatimonadales bacterium]|jgi:hypothetical protein|nr:MAG: hypothetical protein JSU98_04885 [Gemmatimonadales bacterium]